jgi:hypothetical protein
MREVCFDLMTLKNESSADEEFLRVLRKADVDPSIFAWYVEVVYRATGNKHHWADRRSFSEIFQSMMTERGFKTSTMFHPVPKLYVVFKGYRVVWQLRWKANQCKAHNSRLARA